MKPKFKLSSVVYFDEITGVKLRLEFFPDGKLEPHIVVDDRIEQPSEGTTAFNIDFGNVVELILVDPTTMPTENEDGTLDYTKCVMWFTRDASGQWQQHEGISDIKFKKADGNLVKEIFNLAMDDASIH